MSRFPRSELAPLADKIRKLIVEHLDIKDDFMVLPAVIAELYGDRYVNSFEARGAMNFHIGNTMGHVPDFLLNLHAALTAKGHDHTNKFEISSGDRYASVIKDNDYKVLAFENQNFTYMVYLAPDAMSKYKGDKVPKYAMHVRASTPASRSNHHIYNNPGIKGVPRGDELKKAFNEHGGYFNYLDLRDRGFVASIVPEFTYKVRKDGGYDFTDQLVWTGKDSHAMIYGGMSILDELCAYASMHEETFEELQFTVDKPLDGE